MCVRFVGIMDNTSIPIVLGDETTMEYRASMPTPSQRNVLLFQDRFKSDNDHEETFEVIYQEAPSSTNASIKVPNFSEYTTTTLAELNNGPLVTETNVSHLGLNQSLPNQSRILFLASDSILSTSDFSALPSDVSPVINASNIVDETQVPVGDKIFHTRESLCRICASETVKALSLFHNNSLSLNLVEKIHRCLPIKVLEGDDLPQQICEDCAIKLQTSNELINSCVAGNAKLKAMAWMWSKLGEDTKSDDDGKCIASEPPVALSESLAMITQEKVEPQCLEPLFIDGDQQIKEEELLTPELVCPNDHQEQDKDNHGSELEFISDCKHKELTQTVAPEFPGAEGTKVLASPSSNSKCSKALQSERRFWNCSECDYKASRQSSLIFHKQQKHVIEENDNDKTKTESSNTQFLCQYCDKSFQSETKLQKHLLSHAISSVQLKENSQGCTLCDEKLPSFNRLQKHMKSVHNIEQQAKHKCDICGKAYRLASSLDIHCATHSNETPYLCDICGKSFKHTSNLRCHRRSHAEEKLTHPHSCDICTKSFRSKFHLSEHKNVHLNITPYSCDVCGKKFHRRIQLRQHRVIHDSESSFECTECGASFNRRGNMTQHMKRHLEERKFKCKICKESFQTLSEVVQHRREHTEQELNEHMKGTGDFSCSECHKLFSSSNELDSHLKTHSDTKYECEICNKQLSNRRTLDYHIKSFHTLERPFSCQHCSETFLSREACTVHERLHTGEKPYMCSVCNMSFRCSSNLAQHTNTHRDERPWACTLCTKSFKRKGILLVHMRTHTGEKPFCCDICGRRFTQKNDMLKHQQTHSSAKQTFVCGDCNWPFHTRKELNKHRKTLHSNTGQPGVKMVPALPSNSQALLITNELCQFPITILEEGSNVIVHQIEELGKQPQIIELNGSDSESQILHFTDSLLQTVVPGTQILSVQDISSQQVINFESEAVLPSATDQNWLISQPK